MSKGTPIRAYDYVNHPYEQVCAALTKDARSVFQAATTAASSRAHSIASQLRVNLAGIEVATDIAITVTRIVDSAADTAETPSLRLQMEWEAARSPRLFPFMRAELRVYPLTSTETQLDFSGVYEPPLGALGSAMNAIIGHRIAELSVHRFLTEVAEYLRTSLK